MTRTSARSLRIPNPGRHLAEPARFRALVVLNAALLWLIIPSGGLVRLTGSGLGCPDWPLCNGGVVPERSYHAVIEYSNRLLSAGVIAVAVLTWLAARNLRPRSTPVARYTLAAAAMSLGQAPLGALTVLSGLHPMMVSSHFLLSLAALAMGVMAVITSRDSRSASRRAWDRRRGPFAMLALAALLAAVVTGVLVTAAGPHSGDDDVLERFGDLQAAAWIHVRAVGVLVVLMVVLAVWLWRERPTDPAAGRLIRIFLPVMAAQIVVGEVQYRNGLPWQVVVVHVSLAGLVWALGLATAVTVARPRVADASAPAAGDALAGHAPLRVRQGA